jgi:acyl-CoA synthetase (AMP-forming)/AMP-acid ligase II
MSTCPTSLNRLSASLIPADFKLLQPHLKPVDVVPLDDDIKGQKPVAFIIAKGGTPVDAEEITRSALAKAPAYQHPRFVWFLDDLPLSTKNTIDRTTLRHGSARRLKAMEAEAMQ